MLSKILIQNAKSKEVELIFVISRRVFTSPHLNQTKSLGIIKPKCLEHDIPLSDFSNIPMFKEQYHLFSDPSHLDNNGACLSQLFTCRFYIKRVKHLIDRKGMRYDKSFKPLHVDVNEISPIE